MALTRAQLLSGNSAQGVVLPGQVQAVKQGVGITIASDGTISFDPSTATGIVRTNNTLAYNSYVWPTLATAPSAGTILQSDGLGNLDWSSNYVQTTGATGAALLPVGTTAERPAPPAAGGIRYNSQTAELEYYNGTAWVPVAAVYPASTSFGLGLAVDGTSVKTSVPIQNGPPTSGTNQLEAMDGSTYWDDNLGVMFIRYNDGTSTQWVQVVPSGAGGGGGGGAGTVTSVDVTGTGGITSSGGPITSSGSITVGLSLTSLPVLP